MNEEKNIIDYALEFSTEAHKNQKRWKGEPYITHPITVADLAVESFVEEAEEDGIAITSLLRTITILSVVALTPEK